MVGQRRRNGIAAEPPRRAAADVAAELGIPNDGERIVIGQIAAMVPTKGWAPLIEAAARVLAQNPRAFFLCIGPARYAPAFRPQLEARIEELGIASRVRIIAYPNTVLMCCPTGDGAAAAVVVSGERLRSLSPEQQRRAVKISASVLTSDPYVDGGQVQFDVNTLTRRAADEAYEQAGVAPQDLDLVELHDCFATAELRHYDNLRLCAEGGAGEWIDRRGPWRDGEIPVNVSGGLLSKGHPLGATGIANVFEVATHLRGEAGDRQIEGATVGLTHVIGLGSACAIHIFERAAS